MNQIRQEFQQSINEIADEKTLGQLALAGVVSQVYTYGGIGLMLYGFFNNMPEAVAVGTGLGVTSGCVGHGISRNVNKRLGI